jgi:hypothetical protein
MNVVALERAAPLHKDGDGLRCEWVLTLDQYYVCMTPELKR